MLLNILFSSKELDFFNHLRILLFISAYLNNNHRIQKLQVTLEIMYLVCPFHFIER